ncbi:phosphoenolpyruvate--protein phosphotransferase [Oceanitalea stevensii]|uniref:phosphoenolpyruvate--protein phosphotransferase n=1 Tax=Oceanitalea stevensii TaxID=2763072 RepID=UPI002044E263|nr:phosphoenolpyruvate--protein phosphotransferase [Oceanitalea stevensii]
MSTEHARRTNVRGIGVSPGRAAGPVAQLAGAVPAPSPHERLAAGDDVEAAAASVAEHAAAVAEGLSTAAESAEGEAAEILATTAQMAADPTLVQSAQAKVREEGKAPALAVWEAADAVAEQLSALGGYMAERARDVRDVRDRVVASLLGVPMPGIPQREEPFVLVALDLAPADTALLDPSKVRAIVTAEGGPTSHTAILARSLGIPAVVGAPHALEVLEEGRTVLVDGAAGTAVLDPSAEDVAAAEALATHVRTFDGEGRTSDGHRVHLLANVGEPAGAAKAAQAGAEGVGLFRTEFCFLDRNEEPTVAEQVKAYRTVLAAFPGKKVVVRTLDAGADKPMPFLTDTAEPNPALGVRGLRTSWRNPRILDNQLTAIAEAAAAESADVWVMAPMVATVDETEEFVAACNKHGLTTAGVMVEVPSAALMSGPILARAAFASIGTNDLTQYTMAADRLLGSLASLSDAFHPAVLRMIEETCRGGAQQSRPVGVCGEAAADPATAVVLVGLGVSSLSMSPRSLPDVAAVLAATSLQRCQELAQLALGAESAEQARALVRGQLPVLDELGL